MKTFEQAYEYSTNKNNVPSSIYLENRCLTRLCIFMSFKTAKELGIASDKYKTSEEWEEAGETKEWNKENCLEQFKKDLNFAIEKAENERGISTSLMRDVVSMWVYVFNKEEQLNSKKYTHDYCLDYFADVNKEFDFNLEI